MFDIPGQIRKAIYEFLLWVAETGLQPVMDTLGTTALSTPDLTTNPQVKAVWTTSMITANGIYVLFVILGGLIVSSRETVQTQYGFKQIAPRLVMGAVVSNTSLILCGKAIEATNALTAAIAGQGINAPSAANAILGMLDNPLNGSSPNILYALLIIAVVVLGLIVIVTFLLRVALLVILFGIAPLALTCHAIPQTEGIAYTWWRAFVACLGLQVAQAVIVLATVKVFLTPSGLVLLGVPATASGLLGVLVCLTMLWLLIKVPGLMKQYVLAPIGLRGQGRGMVGQLLQAYVMVKTLGAAAGIIGGSRTAARPRAAARQRPAPSTATQAPTRPAQPAPAPRPAPSRPSPTAPVAFSNAPTTHTPLPVPAGTTGAPAFSHPPHPGTPAPAPTGPAPAAPFSRPDPSPPATPRPGGSPAPVPFSDAAPAVPSRTPAGPAPVATFSTPPVPQSAPRRPPAPVTPVFSSAPPTPRRPTAARRRTTAAYSPGTDTPPPVTPPTPDRPPAPATRATPQGQPAPVAPPPRSRPRPTGSVAPVFRPAPPPSPTPPAPSPLPVQRPSEEE